MPVFSYLHKSTTSKGDPNKKIFPATHLFNSGATIAIDVGVTQDLAQQFTTKKYKTPFIKTIATIDTGAKFSCIDIELAKKLQLPVLGQTYIATPSHPQSKVDVCTHLNVNIKGKNSITYTPPRIICCPLATLNTGMLLGRDFLMNVILIYHGIDGGFSISVNT